MTSLQTTTAIDTLLLIGRLFAMAIALIALLALLGWALAISSAIACGSLSILLFSLSS